MDNETEYVPLPQQSEVFTVFGPSDSELRLRCLDMALGLRPPIHLEDVIKVAKSYFDFVSGRDPV